MNRHLTKLAQLTMLATIMVTSPAVAGEADSDETTLRHLKEVLWPKAYAEQDQELLDEILADEFQMVDSEGNWSTKADELDWISKNKPSYAAFEFVIDRLDIFENGTAIVAGHGLITQTDGSRMIYQSSNVLIKRDGRWKAVASHVSGVKKLDE